MGQVLPTTRVSQDNSATYYYSIFGAQYGETDPDRMRIPISVQGIITRVYIKLDGAPGEGKSFRYRLYTPSLTFDFTISDAETEGEARGMALVTPGDLVYLAATPSGSPSAYSKHMSVIFDTVETDESIICGSMREYNLTHYCGFMGFCFDGSTDGIGTEMKYEFIATRTVTLSDLRVRLESSPGTSKSWAFMVRVNEQDTSVTTTISDGNRTGADTDHSEIITAGDRVSLKVTPSGSPAYGDKGYCLKVTGGTHDYLIGGETNKEATFGDEDYAPPIGTEWSNPANQRYISMAGADMNLTTLYVELATAPGAGNSRTLTLIKNGDATALTVTIADANTTGNASSTIALSKEDQFYLKWSKSGTPDATAQAIYGLLAVASPTGPTVTTDKILSGIATGTVSAIGDGSSCSVRGFCYKEATSGDPNVFDDSIVVSGGDEHVDGEFATGEYSLDLSLEAGKLYRVRAFAVNDNALSYATTLAAYYEYPSDAMARVSAIRRIFRPGLYRMEIALGDLGFEWDVAEAAMKKTDEGVGEPEKPEEPPKPELKYPPDEVFVPDWMKPEVSTWDRYRALLEGAKDEQFVSLRPITDTPKVVAAVDVAKEVIGGIGMFISYVTHPGALVTDMIKKLIGWFK